MTSSNIAGTATTYTYDTLGNLVLEKTKNKVVDYQYNELNQLTKKKEGSESYNYTYDKRGNRTAETGKKASRSYLYDETNRMVEGTNWKGDKSAYAYNGLGLRVNNTHTTHAGKVYARDYVIDYTSFENDDLMVFAEGNGQLEYEQKHVYAGSERIEQFTDKGNWERTLYVHEDVMGNTRYYTKANGQSFAELTYDAWGMPESPNKLLNNDHGNYVFATFTGHIYDTTLDIYFAEARFYDANNRTWLAMDPIKDGGNWYQYCSSNPTTYYDPTGLAGFSPFSGCVDVNKLAEQMQSGFRDWKGKLAEFADNIDWARVGTGALKAAGAGDRHNGGCRNRRSSTSGIGGAVGGNRISGYCFSYTGNSCGGYRSLCLWGGGYDGSISGPALWHVGKQQNIHQSSARHAVCRKWRPVLWDGDADYPVGKCRNSYFP